MRSLRPWRNAVIVCIALLVFATAAVASTVTQAPTVSGDPAPGNILSASEGNWTPASAEAVYDWLNCNATGASCTPISGACGREYKVRTDDVGDTLSARLTVTDANGDAAVANSAPTAVVQPRPYIPNVGFSDTCTKVIVTAPGKGTFTSGEETGGGSLPPAELTPARARAFIDPFPVVRISGRFRGKRTKLTRVSVNAPRRTRIRVACKGKGCPYRRKAVAVRLLRVRALQRTYRPKATIEIRVTQRRKIGKYTRVKTRRGKAPLRVDRCLMPEKTRPVRCPTG